MSDHRDHVSRIDAPSAPYRHSGFGADGSPGAVDAVAPDRGARASTRATRLATASADVLLPETIAWYEAMPPDDQPRTLVATYPRIANALCAASHDRQSFDDCVDALLTDGRHERAGFPAGVLRDLLALRAYVHALHADGFGAPRVPVGR